MSASRGRCCPRITTPLSASPDFPVSAINCQQRHRQIGRALHHHRDQRLRTHTLLDQQPGKAVSPRVQLRIGQLLAVEHHRQCVRGPRHLRLEQARQRPGRHRQLGGGVVPLQQHLLTLCLAQNAHLCQRQPRIAIQHSEQVVQGSVGHIGNGLCVDGFHRLHRQHEPAAGVVHRNHQRIVGGLVHVKKLHTLQTPAPALAGVTDLGAVAVVQQRGEQRQLAGDTAGVLCQRQRCVLVLQQIGQTPAHHLHRIRGAKPPSQTAPAAC